MLRIFLDACCLNRPFDDQSQARIRLESEAVLLVLSQIEARDHDWVSSESLRHELRRIQDPLRREQLASLPGFAREEIKIDDAILRRAQGLERLRFDAYDALHLASAEVGRVTWFLTTDDRLLRRARRLGTRLHLAAVNPLDFVTEVVK